MQTTGNLGLKKPEGTDIVDITDLNGNMDILDSTVNGKVDKIAGKQLSTNDYTTAEKTKLTGIATGANNYTHPNHTGDVTSAGDGVTAIAAGVIVDADVNAAAGIAATKIGTGVVSNAEFGYLDGVTSGIQAQLNARPLLTTTPQQTTAALTYYVRTDGNDANTGLANTAGAAFKTIQHAVDLLPKVVQHTINIYIADGTYTENVSVKGFSGGGSLTINGNAANNALVMVTSIDLYGDFLATTLVSITATAITRDPFTVNRCVGFRINSCRSTSTALGYSGIVTYFSSGVIANGTYSNKGCGINCTTSSVIDIVAAAGTGNTIGLGSADGSVVTKSALTLTGTQVESAFSGTITTGVLNPWGDNTLSSRSAVRASMNSSPTLAVGAFTKLPFNNAHQDYSSEFNSALNRFTAKKTGFYLVTGGVANPSAPATTHITLSAFVNGIREIDLGSYNNSGADGAIFVQGASAVYLPAGAYVELYAYASGVAMNTSVGSALSSFTVTQLA